MELFFFQLFKHLRHTMVSKTALSNDRIIDSDSDMSDDESRYAFFFFSYLLLWLLLSKMLTKVL